MFELKTKCFCYDVNVSVSFKPRESTDQNPKVSFCDDMWEGKGEYASISAQLMQRTFMLGRNSEPTQNALTCYRS